MTRVDQTIEYRKLLMVIARKTIQIEWPLPDGYHFASLTESDKDDWCALHVETGLFKNKKEAQDQFEQMIQEDQDFFQNHFIKVNDEQGKLVASAGLWWGHHFGIKRLRIHYVSVLQAYQHKGIARSMLTKLCIQYDQIPNKYPLYLSTQTQSYNAIMVYTKLGFTPYLGAYEGHSQSESEKDWEFATKILKEKSKVC